MGLLDSFNLIKKRNDVIRLFEKFGAAEEKLIEKAYNKNVDAFSVVKRIVDVYSGTDWVVEKKVKDKWEVVENTPLNDLLQNPNKTKNYTIKDIDEQIATYLLCSGNAHKNGYNGRIMELDVLPSHAIDITCSESFFLSNLKYHFEFGKTARVYAQDELEHIKLFNPFADSVEEYYKGLSVFEVASRVVQVGNDKWDASAHLFQNRGMAGLLTDKSKMPMTETEAGIFQKALNKRIAGTKKYGGVGVTNKDVEYIKMSMSSTDLQIVEQSVIPLRAICNVLGLEASLFNDPESKKYNNREQAEKSMYTNVIIPLADKIASKHGDYIVKDFFPEGDHRMRKDFSKVECLQKNKKEEAEKDKVVVEGINTILNMAINMDSKIALIKERYSCSDEFINNLKKTKPNELI